MKKPPLDLQAAARVAPGIQLNDVQCLRLSAGFTADGETQAHLSLSWEVGPVGASWLRTDQTILAVFSFDVGIDGKSDAEPGEPEPARGAKAVRIADVHVTLRLDYTILPGVDVPDADLDDFVGISGYLHLWPYLRAEVQCLTTKLGLPPLVLPVQVSSHAAATVTVVQASELPDGRRLGGPPTIDN